MSGKSWQYMLCKQTSVLITVILLSRSHLNTPGVILIFTLPQQFIIVQIMLTQTKFAWSPHCGSSLGVISLAGSSGHQSASFFLLIIQLLPNYSLRTSGWRATATQENVGARWGSHWSACIMYHILQWRRQRCEWEREQPAVHRGERSEY